MCVGCSSIERVEWEAGWPECLKLSWTGAVEAVVEVVVEMVVEVVVVEVEGKAGKRNTFSSFSSSPVETPDRGGG